MCVCTNSIQVVSFGRFYRDFEKLFSKKPGFLVVKCVRLLEVLGYPYPVLNVLGYKC